MDIKISQTEILELKNIMTKHKNAIKIKKMWPIYAIKYYSPFRKKTKLLQHEDIMLSEMSVT